MSEPLEGEVLPAADPHAVTARRTAVGVEVVCSCGGWDGFYSGPRSASFCQAEHRAHVAEATR